MIGTIADKVVRAVEDGLFRREKFLPSWLFYDENGDRIFQEIMRMPEYYLTGCEYEILDQNKNDFAREFASAGKFNLVELGPGDGLKTEILLKHFERNQIPFSYSPIDISGNVLKQLEKRLQKSLPDLDFNPQKGDYTDVLASLSRSQDERNVILFLGSNIGNFTPPAAIQFLKSIAVNMSSTDLLVLGLDLQKDPEVIRKAYDDPQGITSRFNLNLLTRLNNALGADFDLENFEHAPTYDPNTGIAASSLVSREDQDVYFELLGKSVRFFRGERIHTEVSVKYNRKMIDALVAGAGLRIRHEFYDRRNFFSDLLLSK